jgi:hypothetical protein
MVFNLCRNNSYYVYLDDRYGVEEGINQPVIKRTAKAVKTMLNSKRCRAAYLDTPTSATTTKTLTADAASIYVPKRSSRLASIPVEKDGDGDTWIEIPVTMIPRSNKVDSSDGTRKPRSLFYSIKMKAGVWDEPPSGASHIIYHVGCDY